MSLPKFGRVLASQLSRISGWKAGDKIAAVALITGLPVAIFTVVISNRAVEVGQAPLFPALQVAAVASGVQTDIDDGGGAGAASVHFGAAIDISVKNSGTGVALVTSIDLFFSEARYLCSKKSGWIQGLLLPVASYDIAPPRPLPEMPYRTSRDVRLQIAPNTIERFTVTVGTDDPAPYIPAYLSLLSVELSYDEGRRLEVGRLAIVDAGRGMIAEDRRDAYILSEAVRCQRDNTHFLDRVIMEGDVQLSRELQLVSDELM